MRFKSSKVSAWRPVARCFVAILCAFLIAPGDAAWAAAFTENRPDVTNDIDTRLSPQELDSLVAPVALYPDSLLSQALVASTYPLEIVQLQQWMEQNKNLKGKALSDAAMKQPWDPSVQAMVMFPDMLKQLAGNIKWTTDLGNAFLAQKNEVMDAVQRMRFRAKDNGNLTTTEQQKVETTVIENKETIVIQPANPEVIYVPSYNPTVVYGAPAYPYPPIAYPPPGYYAAGMAVSFGVGMMVGAAWGGGGWGCGWGHNDIYINNNNTFIRNTNVQGGNRLYAKNSGNNTWQHNPQHRGAAPYTNQATASKYGGTARGGSLQNRQATARQSTGSGNRPSAGTMDRGGNRAAAPSAGTMDRSTSRGAGGTSGGDRVGNRSIPSSSARSSGAFGGGSASTARASSSRGSSSFGRGGRSGGGRRR